MNPDFDFKTILRRELTERVRRNPHYSLRAFARDLSISAPRLSEILNGKKGLSRVAALEIGKKLGFTENELNQFCDWVEAHHGRSAAQRLAALERSSQHPPQHSRSPSASGKAHDLSFQAYRLIEDWYPLAILQLLKLRKPPRTEAAIAKRLGISLLQVKEALSLMVSIEMLEKNGTRYLPTQGWIMAEVGIPNASIKRFHEQMLKKAEQALFQDAYDRRYFRSSVLSIDPKKMAEINMRIKKFSAELIEAYNSFDPHAEVIALNLQTFFLSTPQNGDQP